MDLRLFKAEVTNTMAIPGYLKSCMFFAPSPEAAMTHFLSWAQATGQKMTDKAKVNIREIPIPDTLVFMVEKEPISIKL